ncbi:MAG: ACT domain-containing protein [Candidatus Anstonellales archaeon]
MRELKIIEHYRPFLLLEVASAMADNNINIASIRTYNVGEVMIISLLLEDKDFDKAKEIANTRWNVVQSDSIIVELDDRPGQLAKMVRMLVDNNIEIRSSNVIDRVGGKTYLMVDTNDNQRASKILREEFNIS